MRIALIGYGAVAAIHARQLRQDADLELAAVCGPDAAKAEVFAREHGFKRAVSSAHELGGLADAAIICSPSTFHFEHARATLQAGLSTLVEVPACASHAEALKLAEVAERARLHLQCAHTSRYMEPYRRLGDFLKRGALGEIRQIHFVRTLAPRQRSWTDDALLHHAAHPLHLLLHWFPPLRLLGCAAHPQPIRAQQVAVLAALENGAPVTVSVSYHARVPAAHLLVVGEHHTFSTDGFGRIETDLTGQNWSGDAEAVYHSAIRAQDQEFLRACHGHNAGVPWSETVTLAAAIDQLRQLGERTIVAHDQLQKSTRPRS